MWAASNAICTIPYSSPSKMVGLLLYPRYKWSIFQPAMFDDTPSNLRENSAAKVRVTEGRVARVATRRICRWRVVASVAPRIQPRTARKSLGKNMKNFEMWLYLRDPL